MYNPLYTSKRNRDLFGGFNPSASFVPIANLIYGILSWFTITVEAFLRRDFGERYYSKMNFFAGFLLLSWFTIFGSLFNAFSQTPGFATGMSIVPLAYVVMSVVHFFKIWARNHINETLHSLDSGRARLEPLSRLVLVIINPVAEIIAKILGGILLGREHRDSLDDAMPIFKDTRAITERFLEPVFLLILAMILSSFGVSVIPTWLYISALALIIHTNYAYEAERMQALDQRDQLIEAMEMGNVMTGGSKRMRVKESVKETIRQVAHEVENKPKMLAQIEAESPSLADAMAALNPKLKGIVSQGADKR